MIICSTGFEGVDLLHMSKAVKLMGLCMHNQEANTLTKPRRNLR